MQTTPWSQEANTEEVISATAIATASPFVVIKTISFPFSIFASNLKTPGTVNFAP